MATIALRVKTCDVDIRIATGFKVPVKEWSEDMHMLRHYTDVTPRIYLYGLSFSSLTERMMKLRRALEITPDDMLTRDNVRHIMMKYLDPEKFEELHPDSKPRRKETFMEFFETFIQESEQGLRTVAKTSRPVTIRTCQSYRACQQRLIAYERRHKLSLDWDDITLRWLDSWKSDLINDGYSSNYITRLIKIVKSAMRVAKDRHLATCLDFESSYFGSRWVDVENIYLTHDMVNDLFHYDFSDKKKIEKIMSSLSGNDRDRLSYVLSRNLQKAVDLFLIGCFTGQRISDYKRIDSRSITILRDGNAYIYTRQQKTGKDVYIPTDPRLMDILRRNSGSAPSVNDQMVNNCLKAVGIIMGWTHLCCKKDKQGRPMRFADALCSHTARRTFATLAYEDGIPAEAIMTITGHSSEDSFRKYVKTSVKDRAILAAAEFAKVRGA